LLSLFNVLMNTADPAFPAAMLAGSNVTIGGADPKTDNTAEKTAAATAMLRRYQSRCRKGWSFEVP
jgi:hypothetical protein